MSAVAVEIAVRGRALNERSFLAVLPGAARLLRMTAWTIHPGGATLTVGRGVRLQAMDVVVRQMAREVGGTASRTLSGYRIDAPPLRVAA